LADTPPAQDGYNTQEDHDRRWGLGKSRNPGNDSAAQHAEDAENGNGQRGCPDHGKQEVFRQAATDAQEGRRVRGTARCFGALRRGAST